MLIGCSIINGGSGYPFFTPSMYQYIAGTPLQNVTASIDYVPSLDVKDFLTKVSTVMISADDQLDSGSILCVHPPVCLYTECMQINAAEDEEQLREILIDGCEILEEAGYTRPIHSVKLDSKEAIVRAISLHYCVFCIKAELDQVIEGVEYTGLLQYIRRFPLAFEGLLTSKDVRALTAGTYVVTLYIAAATYTLTMHAFFHQELLHMPVTVTIVHVTY